MVKRNVRRGGSPDFKHHGARSCCLELHRSFSLVAEARMSVANLPGGGVSLRSGLEMCINLSEAARTYRVRRSTEDWNIDFKKLPMVTAPQFQNVRVKQMTDFKKTPTGTLEDIRRTYNAMNWTNLFSVDGILDADAETIQRGPIQCKCRGLFPESFADGAFKTELFSSRPPKNMFAVGHVSDHLNTQCTRHNLLPIPTNSDQTEAHSIRDSIMVNVSSIAAIEGSNRGDQLKRYNVLHVQADSWKGMMLAQDNDSGILSFCTQRQAFVFLHKYEGHKKVEADLHNLADDTAIIERTLQFASTDKNKEGLHALISKAVKHPGTNKLYPLKIACKRSKRLREDAKQEVHEKFHKKGKRHLIEFDLRKLERGLLAT